jgi:hypothetical protein
LVITEVLWGCCFGACAMKSCKNVPFSHICLPISLFTLHEDLQTFICTLIHSHLACNSLNIYWSKTYFKLLNSSCKETWNTHCVFLFSESYGFQDN